MLTVVVDGGGSGCRLAAFNEHGVQCARANAGPAQLSLGVLQAWDNIGQGIACIAAQLDLPADWMPQNLCLGLAGALHTERRQQFLRLIPESVQTRIVTDGHAQLLGACDGKAGACLSVGTGSVLHWLDEQSEFGMAGGWGFPAGDEGAGAWLGVQLLIRYCRYLDRGTAGMASMPSIFAQLRQRIGSSVTELQQWTTCKNPTELASLVPLLVEASTENDATACELLNEGVDHCVELLSNAPAGLPIYVVGGLSQIYIPLLAEHDVLRGRLAQPAANALAGLYILSKSSESGLPGIDA